MDLFHHQPVPGSERPLRLARVVLERGIDHPEGLTYAVPESMAELSLGDRVAAPLGRGNAPSYGYVVDLPGSTDVEPGRLKALSKRTGTRFPPTLIRLAQWISLYYCCPIGMVVAAMLPAAVKQQTGLATQRRLRPAAEPPDRSVLTPSLSELYDRISALDQGIWPVEGKELARQLGLTSTAGITRLTTLGLLERVSVQRVRARGVWSLERLASDRDVRPTLTSEQARAVEAIAGTLGGFATHLLYGVTGSGKTEVYLHLIERVLARGQGAIVLVPEISLTPQTAGRFVRRFGPEVVAVLHSGLTASQRHHEWSRVMEGAARVVVGARSAIFAPMSEGDVSRLGVVIVDEEHDTSYKQDQLPRYHARDVALKRAQVEGCPVVLGSATPSLESWSNAARGRFNLIELPDRVAGGKLPRVEIVDMIEERRARAGDRTHLHALGPRLEGAIGAALDAGGQIILLLNRRGFASYIACPDRACGWILTCSQCDVTMVHHRAASVGRGAANIVRCHHCLAEQLLPVVCPMCAKKVSLFGIGTQRLEAELARKFPALVLGETMLRLDSDTMQRAADYDEALERFRSGGARLILGTQMIAKGLDFPGVTLIGVVNADTALSLPDFRVSERTFQLVSQVAGRAGRSAGSAASARVVVQTLNPHEPAIVLASRHDYRGFAEHELALREAAGLPPLWRMARIVFRDEDHTKAEGAALEAARLVRAFAAEAGLERSLRLKGPMPCPISRIAGFHRWSIELLAPDAAMIQRVLTSLRNTGKIKSDARTAVDVDPVTLL